MRKPWAAMIGMIAVVAANPSSAAPDFNDRSRDDQVRSQSPAVWTAELAELPVADAPGPPTPPPQDAAGLQDLEAWVRETYARAPALVLGLAVLLAVPPLAAIGLLLRNKKVPALAEEDITTAETQLHSRRQQRSLPRQTIPGREPARATRAWIEIEGADASRHDLGRSILRIGREADNDICLRDETVHRYHAAVHRTEDAEYVITDLSSPDGNGIAVNGQRVAEARLAQGDTIELGRIRLKFAAGPA